MKRTRTRSIMVLIMTLAFFAGLIYFIANLAVHSAEWSSMPQNSHLSDSNGLENAGKIYDINGVVLAQSVDGKRVYNEDEEIRKACLHVVGDDTINISTAIQTAYRSELSGYNFIFGLGLPSSVSSGRDITLTIDSNVQKAAYEALGSNRGAIVIYNYKTGEILCMVSTPTYDPQNRPSDIDTNDEYEGAYINRAISASYPPGSTFKLVTAAAALENMDNIEDRTYYCSGSDTIGGKEVTCYQASGEVDFKNALAESCNCYFAQLALDLGKDKMTEQAEKMGFNSSIKFDNIETIDSTYNVSKANDNDLAWSGVGQYTVLETPMNMAVISSAIANGGTPVMPHIIKNISMPFGMKSSDKTSSTGSQMMSENTAKTLYDMMDYTVESNYGKSYFSDKLDICAKTGTAEVGNGKGAHAWVTGFAKDKDCPLAFSVIVENGDSGYSVAIPTATAVLNAAADALRNNV
ncbi:MAG: penicillin-binding transpeptidase domain-containing protein [Clostridia bacterium]|nr:penicillin-binding transpeptidase domain-containing protein [Clostridia bacterium]